MITLEKITALAPDQSSLEAARKLLGDSKWPVSAIAADRDFIWGECQGSGATPYRACVALADLGYKCSCPSRKFPCKHNLALMWRYQQKPDEFLTQDIPQWVLDWSARRRHTGKAPEPTNDAAAKTVISMANPDSDPAETAQDSARAAKARERNQQQREKLIQQGLEDFYIWLTDIYDRGLLAFMQTCSAGCRQVAKRLVDAKAGGLASQLDELGNSVWQIPEADRPRYLHQKLSSLYLLAKAYQKTADLPAELSQEVRRLVGWSLTREQLLELPDTLKTTGIWRVLATREYTQNDGLRRTETWLGLLDAAATDAVRFAVLVDYHHVSAGSAVASPFQPGECLRGTVVYFPSVTPLRGMLVDYQWLSPPDSPASGQPLANALAERLQKRSRNPWLPNWPLAVSDVQLGLDKQGQFWLHQEGTGIMLQQPDRTALLPLLGLPILQATITWDGWQGDLLQADTAYGFWSGDL